MHGCRSSGSLAGGGLWYRAYGQSLHEGVFAVCGVEEKSVVGTALRLVHPHAGDDLGGYVEGALVCVCWREYWGWVEQEKATADDVVLVTELVRKAEELTLDGGSSGGECAAANDECIREGQRSVDGVGGQEHDYPAGG